MNKNRDGKAIVCGLEGMKEGLENEGKKREKGEREEKRGCEEVRVR